MNSEEIHTFLMELILNFAIVKLNIVPEYMEPLVIASKLRIQKNTDDEIYSWQNTPLFKVTRQNKGKEILWKIYSTEGEEIHNFTQNII